MSVPGQVEEMAGMHEGVGFVQEVQGAGLVRAGGGAAQEDGPAPSDGQMAQVGIRLKG